MFRGFIYSFDNRFVYDKKELDRGISIKEYNGFG